MANSINLGRFNRWFEKFFNIKGTPTLVDIEAGVQAVHMLDRGVDHRPLEGWNRYSTSMISAAVAAQTSSNQIRNPAGSGAVAVVERIGIHLTTAATLSRIQVGANASGSDLTNVQVANSMDPRQAQTNSTLICSNGSGGSASVFIDTTVLNGLETVVIATVDQEIAILPGQVLRVTDLTVNESMITSFMWRERALEQSELT